jgi:hypothetical protein
VSKPSELPIGCGVKPALATVERPIVNAAVRISDRTIVFRPMVEPPHNGDEPRLNVFAAPNSLNCIVIYSDRVCQ